MKNKTKKILSVMFVFLFLFTMLPMNILKAEEIKTTIFVKDTDRTDSSLEGFKYVIVDEYGNTKDLEIIDKGIHAIILNVGKYTLKEVETKEGYITSKDVTFALPQIDENGYIKEVVNILPKHYKEETPRPPFKPIFEDEEEENKKKKKTDERDLEKEALEELKKYKGNFLDNTDEEIEENKDNDKKDDGRKYGKTGEGKDTLILVALIGFAILSVILAYSAGRNKSQEDKKKEVNTSNEDYE